MHNSNLDFNSIDSVSFSPLYPTFQVVEWLVSFVDFIIIIITVTAHVPMSHETLFV